MRYLLMISLLLPAMATADEQRIGFVAGSTHGVGLGYSKQFKDGRGWQVSALPIVEDVALCFVVLCCVSLLLD